MRKLLFAAAATAALGITALSAPASAQAYFGVGPFGVEVGPGPGHWRHDWDGPRWRHGWRGAYAYGGECRVIRDRTITPSGRVIVQTRRFCD